MRRPAAILAIAVILMSGLRAQPAAASTINVTDCSADSLIAAIETANDETATPGGDTIVLHAGCTYMLVAPYGSSTSSFGLPTISSDVIVVGNGATIQRQDPTGGYGFFSVASGASLLLSRVTLANGAGYVAGFISNSGDTTIANSVLSDNQYGNNESAVVNQLSGALAVIDSTFTNHVLPNGGAGGAIQNKGYLVVTGSTFSGNSVLDIANEHAGDLGGAIFNSGTASIYSSTFTNNRSAAVGGAIASHGVLNIYDSSFVGGSANFGAAIYNTSDLVVQRSYFEGNVAAISGGAIDNGSLSLAQVYSSTFFNNRAGTGGAIANAFSLKLDQVTFSHNTASGGGASLYGTGGLMVAESSIFEGSGSHCAGPLNDFGDNVVYPSLGTCPSTFVVGDPKLLSPAMRGGPTKTMAFGPGSAAVDRVVGCPSFDQRGFPRPAGPKCDSGAFEDQLPTTPGTPGLTLGASPNRGTFTLGWSAATDPDGVGVTYRLYHADADDADFSPVGGTIPTTAYTFTGLAPEAEGTLRYRVEATDGNHSTPSGTSAEVVVDRTPPTAPMANPDRPVDYAASPTTPGWYRDTVTVTFSGSVDPALLDGSAGSGVASISAAQTFTTSGAHVATGTASDYAGNTSAATSLTVQVDAEAPTVTFTSCPADVLLKSTTSALWTASDPSSGLATPAAGSFALDTATIGTRSVTASATDNVGHTTAVACTYRVIFAFTGFLRPLVNPPAFNVWTAGDNVSVSFSLADDQGLAIFEAGYPESVQVACDTDPLEMTGTTTVTTNRGLIYAPGRDGRYSYIWRTDASWAGTCRQLIVKLVDGTYHRANFAFD